MQCVQQRLGTIPHVTRRIRRCDAPALIRQCPALTASHALASLAGLSKHNRTSNSHQQLKCCCQKGALDSQPKLTRQSLQAALKVATQTEGGYLLKLLIVSAIGAAAVKFGSLAISTPIQPSGVIALSIITIPCLVYSAILLKLKD
ncbi:hypothetical protein WJX82_009504 [Trebouxia sp. C0006]